MDAAAFCILGANKGPELKILGILQAGKEREISARTISLSPSWHILFGHMPVGNALRIGCLKPQTFHTRNVHWGFLTETIQSGSQKFLNLCWNIGSVVSKTVSKMWSWNKSYLENWSVITRIVVMLSESGGSVINTMLRCDQGHWWMGETSAWLQVEQDLTNLWMSDSMESHHYCGRLSDDTERAVIMMRGQ